MAQELRRFMNHLMQHKHLIRFLCAGGLNTLFGYAFYAMAVGILHLPLFGALLVSMIAGVIFNYFSYGRIAFQAPGNGKSWFVFLRFVLVYVLTYWLNLVLLNMLTNKTGSPYFAQFMALVVIVPVTYMLLRTLVWRKHVVLHS